MPKLNPLFAELLDACFAGDAFALTELFNMSYEVGIGNGVLSRNALETLCQQFEKETRASAHLICATIRLALQVALHVDWDNLPEDVKQPFEYALSIARQTDDLITQQHAAYFLAYITNDHDKMKALALLQHPGAMFWIIDHRIDLDDRLFSMPEQLIDIIKIGWIRAIIADEGRVQLPSTSLRDLSITLLERPGFSEAKEKALHILLQLLSNNTNETALFFDALCYIKKHAEEKNALPLKGLLNAIRQGKITSNLFLIPDMYDEHILDMIASSVTPPLDLHNRLLLRVPVSRMRRQKHVCLFTSTYLAWFKTIMNGSQYSNEVQQLAKNGYLQILIDTILNPEHVLNTVITPEKELLHYLHSEKLPLWLRNFYVYIGSYLLGKGLDTNAFTFQYEPSMKLLSILEPFVLIPPSQRQTLATKDYCAQKWIDIISILNRNICMRPSLGDTLFHATSLEFNQLFSLQFDFISDNLELSSRAPQHAVVAYLSTDPDATPSEEKFALLLSLLDIQYDKALSCLDKTLEKKRIVVSDTHSIQCLIQLHLTTFDERTTLASLAISCIKRFENAPLIQIATPSPNATLTASNTKTASTASRLPLPKMPFLKKHGNAYASNGCRKNSDLAHKRGNANASAPDNIGRRFSKS